MKSLAWALVPLGVAVGGCFSPNLGPEPFRCGPAGECPSGYTCDLRRDVCHATGTPDGAPGDLPDVMSPTIDAMPPMIDAMPPMIDAMPPPIDAMPADAAPPDAAPPDAAPPDAFPIDARPPDAAPIDVIPPDATVCTANAFVACSMDGSEAIFCNATGDGFDPPEDCGGYGCNAAAGRCNECFPATPECRMDTYVNCDATGLIIAADTRACELGCDASLSPDRCRELNPSNVLAMHANCDAIVGSDMNVMATRTLDLATECTAVQPPTGGNPELCIIVVRDLVVTSTGTLRATGTRVPVVFATRDVFIDGVVDVSADFGAAGPGGTSAPASGGNGSGTRDGGGGGGHAAFGAAGAGSGGTGGGMAGDADLSPLIAAGRGGNGGGAGAAGGGNGGVIQIVSCRTMDIGATAIFDAGGGGGAGGVGTGLLSLPADGGGGGGAGGGILLEAAIMTFAPGAIAVANGGAAGEGGVAVAAGMAINGEGGENGLRSTMFANGGDGGGANAGDGGDGAAQGVGATGGASGVSNSGHGGGGGAVGRLRFNVGPGMTVGLAGVIQSPAASTGTLTSH